MMPTAAAFSAGTPEAMAMPMHKGSATRKTTTEDRKSCLNDPKKPGSAPAGLVISMSFLSEKFAGGYGIGNPVSIPASNPVAVPAGSSDRMSSLEEGGPRHRPGQRFGHGDKLAALRVVGKDFARLDLIDPGVQL